MTKGALLPGNYYHIYNHAVGSDNLFLSDDNYDYFLKRYQNFVSPVAETLAYCLMPNHVHFFVEIKHCINVPESSRYTVSQYVSKQFSNLFSSYSQAFNKQQKRFGSLFDQSFRRKAIESDEHFTNLVKYIHRNPIEHQFVVDISKWKFSSFNLIMQNADSFVAKEKVVAWFGGLEHFNDAHQLELAGQLRESFKLSRS